MKTACIIGAGIGGLSTAALLSRDGWTCHVYEREPLIGGRAMSTNVTSKYPALLKKYEMSIISSNPDISTLFEVARGYTFDLGFHLIGGGKKGACVKLLQELDITIPFVGSRLGLINDKVSYPLVNTADKLSMLPRIMQLLFTRKSKIEEMKKLSMEEMIKKYGRGKLTLLLELFPRLITTVNDLSRISAGETFFAQRELMGGDPVVYPHNGLQSITTALSNYLRTHGAAIHLNTKVSSITIDNGVASGIRCGKDEISYDVIISTLPVQHLFTVADVTAFPSDWVSYIKKLKPSASVVSYHALKNIDDYLLNKAFVFIERNTEFEGDDVVGMIDFKMNHKTGLTPRGTCLVQSYVICSPKEAKQKQTCEALAALIDNNLARLVPSYSSHLDWQIHSAVWHLDGVAKTIDCLKPDVITPVKNLYIAGDCVSSKGVGVNCAADSAHIIIDTVNKMKLP